MCMAMCVRRERSHCCVSSRVFISASDPSTTRLTTRSQTRTTQSQAHGFTTGRKPPTPTHATTVSGRDLIDHAPTAHQSGESATRRCKATEGSEGKGRLQADRRRERGAAKGDFLLPLPYCQALFYRLLSLRMAFLCPLVHHVKTAAIWPLTPP